MPLCRVSVLEEVQRKNDKCCYQQQVDQAARDKASIKPYQPEQQQHYKNCPQHESYLLIFQTFRIPYYSGLCEPECLCVRPHTCCPFRNSSQRCFPDRCGLIGYKRSSAQTPLLRMVRILMGDIGQRSECACHQGEIMEQKPVFKIGDRVDQMCITCNEVRGHIVVSVSKLGRITRVSCPMCDSRVTYRAAAARRASNQVGAPYDRTRAYRKGQTLMHPT